MPRVRLNDNCHGKVLFISDSVKKSLVPHANCLKNCPRTKYLIYMALVRARFVTPYIYRDINSHSPLRQWPHCHSAIAWDSGDSTTTPKHGHILIPYFL